MNCIFASDRETQLSVDRPSATNSLRSTHDFSLKSTENEINDKAAEAKRLLPAVLRQLKNKNARKAFVGIFINRMQVKNSHSKSKELGFSQFETLSEALKIVLTKDTYHSWAELEQFAIDLLPCITNVYRRLESTIIYHHDGSVGLKKGGRCVQQFLYATDEVQYNQLWFRESFWSNMFEQCVQHQICQLHRDGIRQRPIVVEDEDVRNWLGWFD